MVDFKVDFKQLKQDVSIMDVMEHYGVTLTGAGEEKQTDCLLCGTAGALKVNPAKNAWRCHSCKQGGNIIDFAQQKEKLPTIREAAEFLDATVKKPSQRIGGVPLQQGDYNYRYIARIVITIGIEY
jgi:DNA primase